MRPLCRTSCCLDWIGLDWIGIVVHVYAQEHTSNDNKKKNENTNKTYKKNTNNKANNDNHN